jgi:hypothetical protein
MAHLELTIRETRRMLDALARNAPASSSSDSGLRAEDGVACECEDGL